MERAESVTYALDDGRTLREAMAHRDTYPAVRRAPHGGGFIGTRRCVFDGEIGACPHRHRTISAALACAEYATWDAPLDEEACSVTINGTAHVVREEG